MVLSTAGMMLVALGRTQNDPARLRLLVMAGIPFWLAHDLLVGSPLSIADAISAIVGLSAMLKHHRQPPPRPPECSELPAFPSNVVRLHHRSLPDDPARA